jgi:hypothetical protein
MKVFVLFNTDYADIIGVFKSRKDAECVRLSYKAWNRRIFPGSDVRVEILERFIYETKDDCKIV